MELNVEIETFDPIFDPKAICGQANVTQSQRSFMYLRDVNPRYGTNRSHSGRQICRAAA